MILSRFFQRHLQRPHQWDRNYQNYEVGHGAHAGVCKDCMSIQIELSAFTSNFQILERTD